MKNILLRLFLIYLFSLLTPVNNLFAKNCLYVVNPMDQKAMSEYLADKTKNASCQSPHIKANGFCYRKFQGIATNVGDYLSMDKYCQKNGWVVASTDELLKLKNTSSIAGNTLAGQKVWTRDLGSSSEDGWRKTVDVDASNNISAGVGKTKAFNSSTCEKSDIKLYVICTITSK